MSAAPIRVVVWDERQPSALSAYGDFLGNALAADLVKQPGMTVRSVALDDPEQGLSDGVLDHGDVLLWWGHRRHSEVSDGRVNQILQRLKEGRLGIIALHSAHWSKPFIAAMDERAVEDALKNLPESQRASVKVRRLPAKRGLPPIDESPALSVRHYQASDGTDTLEVQMPRCVFPIVNNTGKMSHIRVKIPDHPIALGIPATFAIPQTETYAGPFFVPPPDAVIFEEQWDNSQTFTSGCAWTVGQGRVFYLRPGHETYPIFKQEYLLKIVANAVRWAAAKTSK